MIQQSWDHYIISNTNKSLIGMGDDKRGGDNYTYTSTLSMIYLHIRCVDIF